MLDSGISEQNTFPKVEIYPKEGKETLNKSTFSIEIISGGNSAGEGSCIVFKDRDLCVAFDCGAAVEDVFPEQERQRKKEIIEKLLAIRPEAIIISHYHADHFLALAEYLLELKERNFEWPLIVATKLTSKLLSRQMEMQRVFDDRGKYICLDFAKGTENIELIPTIHSVSGSAAALVTGKTKTVLYTGDLIDFDGEYGFPKVDYLIIDSTRGLSLGEYDPGAEVEAVVTMGKEISTKLASSFDAKVFVSMFSTQLWRTMFLRGTLKELGHESSISGASYFENMRIYDPSFTGKNGNRVIFCTGVWAQGWHNEERESTLVKLAKQRDRKYELKKGDLVIISGSIPTWSPEITSRIREMCVSLIDLGADVIVDVSAPEEWEKEIGVERKEVHVSGHGSLDDLMKVVKNVRPKTVLPVHGELKARQKISLECGKRGINVSLLMNGETINH